MVTVFIRLVIGCLDYICFHVLNVLFACVFSNTDCFLVGVQIKVIATSDLWLFIHASKLLRSTPHPNSPTLVSDFIFIFFFFFRVWVEVSVPSAVLPAAARAGVRQPEDVPQPDAEDGQTTYVPLPVSLCEVALPHHLLLQLVSRPHSSSFCHFPCSSSPHV